MTLYHYTCNHGAKGIQRAGLVYPNHHPLLGFAIAWFTDLEAPDPDDVGLTSTTLDCDRLAHRFTVDPSACHRWLGSNEHARTPLPTQRDLHWASKPEHWWVSIRPVPILT